MRASLLLALIVAVVGCGNSDNAADLGAGDMSASATDLSSGGGDMLMITPYNMPGSIYCYGTLTCSTTSATPVCCDQRADGGFSDSCVASAGACGGDAYQCGQAADCGSGMVCCGMTGMSGSGKPFLKSTTCSTSCNGAQTQLCVTAGECKTSGASCVGQAISGRNIGLCK